ncbi:hypothetical protein M758_10G023900 [Ceratodon purpureus]|nr:hypothetical protein M758_10G023900 [Ceratodon purpureus]
MRSSPQSLGLEDQPGFPILCGLAGTLGWWAALGYGDTRLGKDTNFKICLQSSGFMCPSSDPRSSTCVNIIVLRIPTAVEELPNTVLHQEILRKVNVSPGS